MTSILFALVVVALVVYGLERNHHRQIRLGTRLAGSVDIEDRDLPRVQADLHATTTRSHLIRSESPPTRSNHTPALATQGTTTRGTRTASGPRPDTASGALVEGTAFHQPINLQQSDQRCLTR